MKILKFSGDRISGQQGIKSTGELEIGRYEDPLFRPAKGFLSRGFVGRPN